MKTITSKEFSKLIHDAEVCHVPGLLTEYLNATYSVMPDGNGKVLVCEEFETKLKRLTEHIGQGDLVWSNSHGFLLIIDLHPAINDDGHHYRALKTNIGDTGNIHISCHDRSVVVDSAACLRIRATTFDLPAINKLCFERYRMYARIVEIDTLLDTMKEK
jgi:hypothetical protein